MPPLLLIFVVCFIAIPDDIGLQGKPAKTVMQALREFDVKGSLLLTTSTTLFILGLVCTSRTYIKHITNTTISRILVATFFHVSETLKAAKLAMLI